MDSITKFFKYVFSLLCILITIGIMWYICYWCMTVALYHGQKYYANNKESIQQAPEKVLEFIKPAPVYKEK